jgi:hypothetical protein
VLSLVLYKLSVHEEVLVHADVANDAAKQNVVSGQKGARRKRCEEIEYDVDTRGVCVLTEEQPDEHAEAVAKRANAQADEGKGGERVRVRLGQGQG